MNRAIDPMLTPAPALPVPPEETERRISEYRAAAFEHQAEPIVVYSPPNHPCPWSGCGHRIASIKLELEKLIESAKHEELLKEFWLGRGLVAACPSCGNLVAYGVRDKTAIRDPGCIVHLPAGWHQLAHVSLAKS